MNNGDVANIRYIGDVLTKVEILGRVKSPGLYSSTGTLKEVLDLAGGFNDPLFRQSIRDDEILVLRKDSNQFYGLEFKISYNESDKFNLIASTSSAPIAAMEHAKKPIYALQFHPEVTHTKQGNTVLENFTFKAYLRGYIRELSDLAWSRNVAIITTNTIPVSYTHLTLPTKRIV